MYIKRNDFKNYLSDSSSIKFLSKFLSLGFVFTILFFSTVGCGYNKIVSFDEGVSASWSEVLNQYKRRADLIPNLVNTVKGYAKFEKDTLTAVIEARAKATSTQINGDALLKDPSAFQKFQQAQGTLSSALSRLMVVVERYPDLKASSQFTNLQAALEGAENRIAVARKRYIDSVKNYNTTIRRFPTNLWAKMFDFAKKPNFTVDNVEEVKKAPSVDFK